MILKNVLLIVKDIERSRRFYQDLLGLTVTADLGKKILFAGGVVIEESSVWEDALRCTAVYGNHDAELYFEDPDIENIRKKLRIFGYEAGYLKAADEEDSEVIRFYDPDGHIIEVRRSSTCA